MLSEFQERKDGREGGRKKEWREEKVAILRKSRLQNKKIYKS